MIDQFDSEFLSQELRDAWKKIEELEKENRELKEQLEKLEKIRKDINELVCSSFYVKGDDN